MREAPPGRPRIAAPPRIRQAQQDPRWVRWSLILASLAVVGLLIAIPVVHVFSQALADGLGAYWKNHFGDPDTLYSMLLTLTVVPVALAANILFGIAAAWAIARFS